VSVLYQSLQKVHDSFCRKATEARDKATELHVRAEVYEEAAARIHAVMREHDPAKASST
jgi:hypothetical protein